MHLSAPIFRLKRQARLISRAEGIPLSRALDRLAKAEGYARWSELAARAAKAPPGAALYRQLTPGDLLLLAARPQQGKTVIAVQMLIAAAEGRPAWFFTLEDSAAQAVERIRREGGDPEAIHVDTSEEISAGHIIAALRLAPAGSLAVIDYLQLLDQRRDKPELAQQIADLRDFIAERGLILCALSQIDRHYAADAKPLPDRSDLRLPNRLDPALFTRHCFLQGGRIALSAP